MAFKAVNLAYRVWSDLGKIDALEEFVATGGSTTTVIDGKMDDREDRQSDNYSIDFTAIVVHDAGGSNAAPEGEMQRIKSFDSATYTHTVDTAFSAAVASGDYIAIANSDIPLREMYRIINRAVIELESPLVDTSLTSAAQQTEYALPVALKREELLRVEYQGRTNDTDNNEWIPIRNWKILPAAPGSTGLLIIPQLPSGRTIKLVYLGVHPEITTFSSTISEYIHPSVVIALATKMALRWLNGQSGGKENYWLQRENEAAQDYEKALQLHPVTKTVKTTKFFIKDGGNVKDLPPSPIL